MELWDVFRGETPLDAHARFLSLSKLTHWIKHARLLFREHMKIKPLQRLFKTSHNIYISQNLSKQRNVWNNSWWGVKKWHAQQNTTASEMEQEPEIFLRNILSSFLNSYSAQFNTWHENKWALISQTLVKILRSKTKANAEKLNRLTHHNMRFNMQCQ